VLPDFKAEAASASLSPELPDVPLKENADDKADLPKEESRTKSPVTKPVSPEDEFDLLTKRFAALKKR
jgi:vacuolar protein sorting-associated protein IST1